MTLKTGGVGLNLTAADTVFIFEPWWNKAAEEQAINRLHRFGQKSKEICLSLITKGSIEEKIQILQQQKADLFKGLGASRQLEGLFRRTPFAMRSLQEAPKRLQRLSDRS